MGKHTGIIIASVAGAIVLTVVVAAVVNAKKTATNSSGSGKTGDVLGTTPPYYVGVATDGRTPNPVNPPLTDIATLAEYKDLIKAYQGNGQGYSKAELTTRYNDLANAGVPEGFKGIAPLPSLADVLSGAGKTGGTAAGAGGFSLGTAIADAGNVAKAVGPALLLFA